jgi:hypothetical protein
MSLGNVFMFMGFLFVVLGAGLIWFFRISFPELDFNHFFLMSPFNFPFIIFVMGVVSMFLGCLLSKITKR